MEEKQQEEIWKHIIIKNEKPTKTKTKQKRRRGNETFIQRESRYGGIRKEWGDKWMCARCPYKWEEEGSLRNHLAMTHKEAQSKNIQCPECGKISKHMGNLKQHQIQKECGENQNGKQKTGEEEWGEICFRNPLRGLRGKQKSQNTCKN